MSIGPVAVKPKHVGEVAVLEDPHHRPERRRQAEHVEHERLDRHEHAAGQQEQQDERGHHDQPERERQPCADRRLGVDELGRPPAHRHVDVGGVEAANVADEALAVARRHGSIVGTTDSQPELARA